MKSDCSDMENEAGLDALTVELKALEHLWSW